MSKKTQRLGEKLQTETENLLRSLLANPALAAKLCFQTQSMHVEGESAKKKRTKRKQSLLLLNTAHMLLHSCRPIQLNPVLYRTYHCGPLSPLICCQTGRPGRKPWRGSCVNHAEEKEITVETVKADWGLIPLLTCSQHAALPPTSSPAVHYMNHTEGLN